MTQHEYRAWDGKQMDYDYRDVSMFHGILVAEGDTLLLEYTGCKDKNGKKIYEGDILHDPLTGKRYPVVFENGAFRTNGLILAHNFPHDEVIGTIYENPDLLEQRENGHE